MRQGVTGPVAVIDNDYTRDDIGRITAIKGLASDNWTYGYDTLDRLTNVGNLANTSAATPVGGLQMSEAITYAANGNMLKRDRWGTADDLVFTYPSTTAARAHAPATIKGVAVTYDANGNMTYDGARTFVWDNLNRLSSLKLNNIRTAYIYGPDGSRAKKRPYDTASEPFVKISLYPSGGSEINQPLSGSMASSGWERVHYPHPDIKITVKDGVIAKEFLHRDHLASVRAVTHSLAIRWRTIHWLMSDKVIIAFAATRRACCDA